MVCTYTDQPKLTCARKILVAYHSAQDGTTEKPVQDNGYLEAEMYLIGGILSPINTFLSRGLRLQGLSSLQLLIKPSSLVKGL